MLLLLAACVPPGVYGLRFDGSMPMNTEFSAVGGVFPGSTSDDLTLADTSVAGLQARQRLTSNVAVELAAGFAPSSLDSGLTGAAEVEIEGRILRDAPVTVSLTGGLNAYTQFDTDNLLFGADVGAVVSRGLPGNLRPYAGLKFNPMFNPDDKVYPWVQYGGGLSWRPEIEAGTQGFFAIEASGYHGFSANVLDDTDIVTWGLMVQAGASFGSGRSKE